MANRNIINFLGKKIINISNHVGKATQLFEATIRCMFTAPAELKSVLNQISEVGIRSLGVILLSSLFTGMVFSFHMCYVTNLWLGSPALAGLGISVAMLKELGPMITGLVLAGRVGAQISAELGTMKVTEQIDALYTLGTNPVKYLYVPRFIACMIAVPLLTMYAGVIGIFGGFLVSAQKFKVPSSVFWNEIIEYVQVGDVAHGVIKAFFFGLIIVTVSCYRGLDCRGGAEGVGKATTSAVVISMILILISDYFLTTILMTIGIGVE